MSGVYIPIRAVDDIQTAVELLIEGAVEKALEETETFYENKIDDLNSEILRLNEIIEDLTKACKELNDEIMKG